MEYKKVNLRLDTVMQALAFQPVLPPEGVPDVLVQGSDGNYYLQILAPDAKEVVFVMGEAPYPCEKDSNGVWRCVYPFRNGMNYVHLQIDGVTVLTPYLPIGYGYSRPSNYVALTVEEDDFSALKDVPHGSIHREYFQSSVLGEWESCIVYTPPQYEPEKELPVLYLQHGHGENEIGWTTAGRMQFILDNLIAEGKSMPFAVVMNNGMTQIQEGEKRVVDFRLFEKMLLSDVIPFVEKKYRIGGAKEKRAMAGLSMGSLQTSLTGLTHPELFCVLGIFSGFLHNVMEGSELDMIERGAGDDAHLELLKHPEQMEEEFDLFFRAIGKDDPFFSYFAEDDRLCKNYGVRQVRKIYDGSHDWNVWRQCFRDFAMLVFRPRREV